MQQPVYSHDGATLYTVSHDGKAIAWDMRGDRRLGRPFTFTDDRTFSSTGYDGHPGAFSPDGRLIAVGLKRHGVTLRDAHTLKPVGAPLLQTGGEIKNLAFSGDGTLLAAVTDDGSITLWDVRSRARLHGIMRGGGGGIRPGVGFSPDGSTLATSSYRGVFLWDVATGARLDDLVTDGTAGDLAFSTDGALVAFARGDAAPGGAEVWDFANRTSIFTADGLADDAWDLSVALSPDSRLLAVGGTGSSVRLWDIRSGKLVHVLEQGANGAFTLEFSPDGRTLAVSGFEPVASLWDVASGIRIGPQLSAGDRRTMIDLSPDGRRLLETHGNGKGAVWDVDPTSWERRACAVAKRTLTRAEWTQFLPGRPYEPACAT